MSEIPFVRRLGDALESAAATRLATRRRLRRRLGVGALGLAIAASGVAAASGILTGTAEELAVNSVGCFEQLSLEGGSTILSTGTDTPIETCARILGTDRPLTACAYDGFVAVFPGRNACRRLGLPPVPAGYDTARARVVALHRAVVAIEASADCIPPEELARRAQALLDRTGWEGWRAVVRDDIKDGACASITSHGGDGERYFEGSLWFADRELNVFPGVSRSFENLLYSTEEGIAGPLMDASGERCYDRAGLDAMVRERIASTGRRVELYAAEPLIEGASISGPRGRRQRDGCAVIVEVGPAEDGEGIRVGLLY
jgi:hypothetical protein